MHTNATLKLAFPARPARVAPVRVRRPARPAVKASAHPASHQAVAPSAGARAETVLMGVTFVALASMALFVEAAGVATTLLG